MSEQLQLCDFEQSKKLNEAGFDWKVDNLYFYDLDNPTEQDNHSNWVEDIGHSLEDWNNYTSKGELYISRPTVALALKWLREVKKVVVTVTPVDDWEHWSYRILMEDFMSPFFEPVKVTDEFPTHDLAESAALTKALITLKQSI